MQFLATWRKFGFFYESESFEILPKAPEVAAAPPKIWGRRDDYVPLREPDTSDFREPMSCWYKSLLIPRWFSGGYTIFMLCCGLAGITFHYRKRIRLNRRFVSGYEVLKSDKWQMERGTDPFALDRS